MSAVGKVSELVHELGFQLVVRCHPRDDFKSLERTVDTKLRELLSGMKREASRAKFAEEREARRV